MVDGIYVLNETKFGVWLNKEEYPEAKIPYKAHQTDAGFDLFAVFKKDDPQGSLVIGPLHREIIHTGVHINLLDGWEAQIRPRSGLAAKKGITVLNTPGTIDSSYSGEIMVILQNNSQDVFTVNPGDKIAQMVIKRVPSVGLYGLNEKPTNEDRGDSGFGSTGEK